MIGYACQIAGSTDFGLKTCRINNATTENLMLICDNNIKILDKIIDYNIQNNIMLFRISSDIIPFASHEKVDFDWKQIYKTKLKQLGEKIKTNKMRISMHPGQYCILNSPNKIVVERTIAELEYHCDFLDLLELESDCKLILHVGGAYGDIALAQERFCDVYKSLKTNIKKRLVLENDEKIYNINQVLELCKTLNMPAVFDIFHHKVNPPENKKSFEYYLLEAKKTWNILIDGKQKIHYSQQQIGAKIGSHSQTININKFIQDYQEIQKYNNCDIMLEVKDKNLSALKCIHVTQNAPKKTLEKQHAKYKYLVMAHSQKYYEEMRKLFAQEQVSALEFYQIVEKALATERTIATVINTAQHIWGYFKKEADTKLLVKFTKLCEQSKQDLTKQNLLWSFLIKLAIDFDKTYLSQSYIYLL